MKLHELRQKVFYTDHPERQCLISTATGTAAVCMQPGIESYGGGGFVIGRMPRRINQTSQVDVFA